MCFIKHPIPRALFPVFTVTETVFFKLTTPHKTTWTLVSSTTTIYKKSCKTWTSLAALTGIVFCVYHIMWKLATCSQSQRTVQSTASAACWLNALAWDAWRRPFPCSFYCSCDRSAATCKVSAASCNFFAACVIGVLGLKLGWEAVYDLIMIVILTW